MNARREFTVTVLACVVGAGLSLFAASRTWSVAVQPQPYPLPPKHIAQTGTQAEPLLLAMALVALAGAGALLATRNVLRIAVGVVLVLSGIGVLGAAGHGIFTISGVRAGWPLAAIVGAALIVLAGLRAVVRARRWPTMSSRYERPLPGPAVLEDAPQYSGPSRSDVAMWDALDRGEDPTRRGD
jgi:hypothetical protein